MNIPNAIKDRFLTLLEHGKDLADNGLSLRQTLGAFLLAQASPKPPHYNKIIDSFIINPDSEETRKYTEPFYRIQILPLASITPTGGAITCSSLLISVKTGETNRTTKFNDLIPWRNADDNLIPYTGLNFDVCGNELKVNHTQFDSEKVSVILYGHEGF
ncbi:MAG: hypothetical protein AAF571_13250 [Verrucomicrobiota bacterium]